MGWELAQKMENILLGILGGGYDLLFLVTLNDLNPTFRVCRAIDSFVNNLAMAEHGFGLAKAGSLFDGPRWEWPGEAGRVVVYPRSQKRDLGHPDLSCGGIRVHAKKRRSFDCV
jgi:hypothetical protein